MRPLFGASDPRQLALLIGNWEDTAGGHACVHAPQLCPLPWRVQASTAGQLRLPERADSPSHLLDK